jgi:lysophospholipid acyltransferase (LPLAT)-like uncharacterized protein
MRLVSFLAYLLVQCITLTLRVRHVRPENIENTPQYIYAFWHAHMLPLLGRSRWHKPMVVMISRSKDGELIAQTLSWYGVESARGSSSRGGGSALREMLRHARLGKNIAFTPDGPRGPARILKEGLIYAAQASALPIVIVAFGARRKKRLRSWDRMIIPMPFTRGVFVYGEPLLVPRDGDIEEWRQTVEKRMNELADEAERRAMSDQDDR